MDEIQVDDHQAQLDLDTQCHLDSNAYWENVDIEEKYNQDKDGNN